MDDYDVEEQTATKQNHRAFLAYLCVMMMFMGITEASIGPNLPAIQAHYNLSRAEIARIVIPHALGFMGGALLVNHILQATSIRGSLMIGALCWLVASLCISLTPPFPIVWIASAMITFGGGIVEVLMSTLGQQLGSEKLSLLWGVSHVGALSAPILVGLHVQENWPWYQYYRFLAVLTLPVLVYQWFRLAQVKAPGNEEEQVSATRRIGLVMKYPAVLISMSSFFLSVGFLFLALEWLPSWFLEVKKADPAMSRYLSGALSSGIAISRILPTFIEDPILNAIPTKLTNMIEQKLPDWRSTFSRKQNIPLLHSLGITMALLILWSTYSYVLQGIALFSVGYLWGPFSPLFLETANAHVAVNLQSSVIGAIIASGFVAAATLPYIFGLAVKLDHLPFFMMAPLILLALVFLQMPDSPEKQDYLSLAKGEQHLEIVEEGDISRLELDDTL